jgi:hypothetical protein
MISLIPGLADADAHFAVVSAKRTSLETSLAGAAKELADATARRGVLVRKIASGEEVAAAEFRECDAACHDASTRSAIISEALPPVIELVRRAKAAGDKTLVAEAQRLATLATAEHAAAARALEAAQMQERATALAAGEARRFVSVASNRKAWGERVPSLAAKADVDLDELARKYPDPIERRNAIADAILAAA